METKTGRRLIRLDATCPKCNHDFSPFGTEQHILPYDANLTCPSCEEKFYYIWYDEETNKMLTRKQLGLIGGQDEIIKELQNKVKLLEEQIKIIQQQQDIQREKNDNVTTEVSKIKNWASIREQDFQNIERISQDLSEDEKFRQQNK